MRTPSHNRLRSKAAILALICSLFHPASIAVLQSPATGFASVKAAQKAALSKTDFDIIEGVFHDGLGTYAEIVLANELIAQARLSQSAFDNSLSKARMLDAIERLPSSHESRKIFQQEIANIESAARRGATELLNRVKPSALTRVRHVPKDYANAKAGDLLLEFKDRAALPVSVKTDKSGKVAVAEGQTPHIGAKWAERYFKVSEAELNQMILDLGFSSMEELKSHYLNVSRLVAHILIAKLGLAHCQPADFSKARVTNLDAAKYLFHQLLLFKRGHDGSRIIILALWYLP